MFQITDLLYDNNYSFHADVCSIAVCILCWILLQYTYNSRNKRLFLFRISTYTLIIASVSNIIFHYLLDNISHGNLVYVYITRNISYMLLIFMLEIFFVYICNIVELTGLLKKLLVSVSALVYMLYVLILAFSPVTHFGFWVDKELKFHQNYVWDPFRFAYCTYFFAIIALVIIFRKKYIQKVLQCIGNVILLSFALMVIQTELQTATYTTMAFTLPIIAMLFLFHYNLYDFDTGTLDSKSFASCLHDMRNKDYTIIWLYIQNVSDDNLQKLSKGFFEINGKVLKHPVTFRLRDDKLACVYRNDFNLPDRDRYCMLHERYEKLCSDYRTDYKMVIMNSDNRLVTSRDYQDYDDFIESRIKINSICLTTEDDLHRFLECRNLTEQLTDIHTKSDLLDERVKVYFQPIYNTVTGTFTSAEVLMRLELSESGIVFPDQFISIAEKFGYIHTLSKIILNKTCLVVKQLVSEGYYFDRISVNFSVQELRSANFCEDIVKIIKDNGVNFDKIAVELSESRNERDFENVKSRMTDLQKLGIKFYLDDFGTGYSNFERIMQLPIDIIKFDRSLTVMADKDEESRFMVESFVDIFQKADYQILFEGVETENDEKNCLKMKAVYLQGYRYSKPLPLEYLRNYLEKN